VAYLRPRLSIEDSIFGRRCRPVTDSGPIRTGVLEIEFIRISRTEIPADEDERLHFGSEHAFVEKLDRKID